MSESTKKGSRRRRLVDDRKVQPLLFTIPEVAVSLGLGRTKVYDLIANDGLPFVKLGTAMRVPVASLQKWVEQREKLNMSA
jgi:excisionase family DNA binding protein